MSLSVKVIAITALLCPLTFAQDHDACPAKDQSHQTSFIQIKKMVSIGHERPFPEAAAAATAAAASAKVATDGLTVLKALHELQTFFTNPPTKIVRVLGLDNHFLQDVYVSQGSPHLLQLVLQEGTTHGLTLKLDIVNRLTHLVRVQGEILIQGPDNKVLFQTPWQSTLQGFELTPAQLYAAKVLPPNSQVDITMQAVWMGARFLPDVLPSTGISVDLVTETGQSEKNSEAGNEGEDEVRRTDTMDSDASKLGRTFTPNSAWPEDAGEHEMGRVDTGLSRTGTMDSDASKLGRTYTANSAWPEDAGEHEMGRVDTGLSRTGTTASGASELGRTDTVGSDESDGEWVF